MTLLPIFTSAAQDRPETCPAIVETALEAVDTLCGDTARNQVCYGNLSLEADFRPDAASVSFASPGDLVDVIDLAALRLSGMNVDEGTWGVALMRLQANLPATLPGQGVNIMLVGNVQIEPTYIPTELPAQVVGEDPLDVFDFPQAGTYVVLQADPDAELIAVGRTAAGDWLRILSVDRLSDGWAPVGLVAVDGDIDSLNVMDDFAPVYGPMQAFYLTTGIGDAACAEAPEDGLLVQTPEGAGLVTFNANGVDITLGSTAWLQAAPGDVMELAVVEGMARVFAAGQGQVVPAGSFTTIPLAPDGQAAGPPEPPQLYDPSGPLGALPLSVLPRAVTLVTLDTDVDLESAAESAAVLLGETDESVPVDIFNSDPVQFAVNFCFGESRAIVAGDIVQFHYGIGRWDTVAEAAANIGGATATIAVDGAALPINYSGLFWQTDPPGPPGYGNDSYAFWTATAGDHTVTGDWSGMTSDTCTVAVSE